MNSRTVLCSIFLTSLTLLLGGWVSAWADASHVRIIRLSLVQGDVRFARDVHGDPLTSDRATWEGATLNLPIRQGYVLATDHGRAEVEFENGAMAFLAENTVLEFYDLSLEDGAKTTRLVLRQGTASFYVNTGSEDYFSVTGGDFTAEADGRAGFRLDNFDDGSVVDVTKGRVSVLRKDKATALVKGQSLSMRAGDKNSTEIARLPIRFMARRLSDRSRGDGCLITTADGCSTRFTDGYGRRDLDLADLALTDLCRSGR